MDHNSAITVYARVNGQNRITAVDSNTNQFVDFDGWKKIDRSDSGSRMNRDAYGLPPGNYFPGSLTNPDGTHRYIYDASRSPAYREVTAEELAAERAEIEAARVPPAAETERLDMIQEIVEMRAQLAQLQINGGM